MQPSTFIRPRQAREIMRAARFAYRAGRDLTKFVVLNLPTPAIGDELAAQRAFCSIRDRARSWWDYRRKKNPNIGPLTDVRTWENKNGVLHVNWLVHVPPHLSAEFDTMLDQRTTKVLGNRMQDDLKVTPITNLNGVLRYVLKGTERHKAAAFDIRHEDQGVIWGRRAVASINLGRTARDKAWQDGTVVHTGWKYRRPSPHAV